MRVFQELNNAHTRPSVPWHSSFILFKSYTSRQLLGTENCSPESVPAVRHEMASQPYTTNFVATRESIFRRAHLLFSRLQDNVNWKTDSQLMLKGKLSWAINLKKTAWTFQVWFKAASMQGKTARIWRAFGGERDKSRQGRRETTLIGGVVFIESPEYYTFIKLPEFYWMH